MSSLISSLQTASGALNAFSRALGVEETNVSNSSTAGYVALRASIHSSGSPGNGGGQDSVDITSSGDLLADALVRTSISSSSSAGTSTSQLGPVNQLFDITGSTGILNALQQFSTSFSNLSVSPNDQTLRSLAIGAAQSVASSFRSVAGALDTQQTQVDSGIQSTVAQINTLAGQIRQYNVQARGQSPVDPGTDAARRSALDQLAALVDISTTANPDGTVSVLAGGQQPLVLEDQSYSLSANPGASAGSQISSSGGGASPSSYSGKLGALLDIRNNAISSLIGGNGDPGALNTLAKGFASRVNDLFASGATAAGSLGVPLFTFDSSDDSNVARTLSVDNSVTPDQLALATTGVAAQSNGVANQLAALAGSSNAADQIAGHSALDFFSSIAAGVGQKAFRRTDRFHGKPICSYLGTGKQASPNRRFARSGGGFDHRLSTRLPGLGQIDFDPR